MTCPIEGCNGGLDVRCDRCYEHFCVEHVRYDGQFNACKNCMGEWDWTQREGREVCNSYSCQDVAGDGDDKNECKACSKNFCKLHITPCGKCNRNVCEEHRSVCHGCRGTFCYEHIKITLLSGDHCSDCQ